MNVPKPGGQIAAVRRINCQGGNRGTVSELLVTNCPTPGVTA